MGQPIMDQPIPKSVLDRVVEWAIGGGLAGIGVYLGKLLLKRMDERAEEEKQRRDQRALIEKTALEAGPMQFQLVIAEWKKIFDEQREENERCRKENEELRQELKEVRDELEVLRRQFHRLRERVNDSAADGS